MKIPPANYPAMPETENAARQPETEVLEARRGCPLAAVRVFCEVVGQNNFSRAARALNVTPSAVSQRIKQLETYIGCDLFARRHAKIVLTEEGRFLHETFERALGNIDRAVNHVAAAKNGGKIVLGILASLTSKWLIPRMQHFYKKHPSIHLITRSVNHTIDVEKENVELAVINLSAPPVSPGLRWELLWRETLFAVCSPEYLKSTPRQLGSIADLRHHTLLHDQTEIASKRELNWKAWLRAAAPEQRMTINGGRYFTQSDLTLQAAIEGHGVALARLSLAAEDLRRKKLVEPLGVRLTAKSGCYACARKGAWDSPKIAALREWLKTEAENDRRLFESGAGN